MSGATDGQQPTRVVVLLDASAAASHRDSHGYLDTLVRCLHGDLVVTCQRIHVEHYRRLAPAAIIVPGPRGLRFRWVRMLWRQLILPRIARHHDVDVVHSPLPPVPLLLLRPRVVTVHDLSSFDKGVPIHRRSPFRRLAVRAALRVCDEVIVPRRETAVALERATRFPASEALVLPSFDRLDVFAAAHRVAYRSAAAVMPVQTGPITLPQTARAPATKEEVESHDPQ